MFKIESYLTPYISAYLAKYVKDFSIPNFQLSFWQGDAVFHNVNLNLEALENELRLPPLMLVSGHIHELRLNVPWTKITSEPIRVYINTFEIVLKLRGQQACDTSPKCSSTSLTSIMEKMKSPPEEEGYMKNLAKKVLQNVEIVFENVVLKYVEDDIVLSLNIRKVVSQCVNNKWEPAFVELNPPTFILRKLWTCSDLTICLDRTNNVGKIEQYMDPILYRCSFEVRVLYQYHGLHSQIPFFGRYDVKIKSMNFSIITEQLVILARLYHLVKLLTYMDTGKRSSSKMPSATTSDEGLYDESNDDSMLGWAAWAVSWVPAIPEVIFGPSDESMEPVPECEFAVPVVHYGIFIENAVIELKLVERTSDKLYYRKPARMKYTPFLKCETKGIAVDLIFRGLDANFKMGVSEVLVNGCGFCPCGIDDSNFEGACSIELSPFLRIGEPNPDYASESMFNPKFELMGDVRPPVDYHFKLERHFEEYTDEDMLKRTPGIALEFLELDSTPLRATEDEGGNSLAPASPVTSNCSLCRLVTGKTHVKVCSGSIHRARLIYNYINQVDKSHYDFLHDIVFPKTKLFNEVMNTVDGRTLATFKFLIHDPLIEVFASDHPDYDEHSHIRAFHQRRKCTNMKPLTSCSKMWPKLVMICHEINGHYTEPTVRFVRFVECYSRSFVDHPDVVSDYAAKLKISVGNLTTRLVCGDVDVSLIEPCTFSFKHEDHFKPSIQSSDLEPVRLFEVHIDSLLVQISKPNLMTCHIILRSTFEESMSLALIYTTLMDDLLPFKNCDFVFGLMDASFAFSRTNTITSYRASLKSATFSATLPEFGQPVQLLEAPVTVDTTSDKNAPPNLVELFLQYPTSIWDEDGQEESHTTSPMKTSACAVYVGACRVNLYLPVTRWLTYAPGTNPKGPSLPPSIPEIVKTCKRLQPISPLGKNSHHFMASTSGPEDPDSRSSTSMGSQGLTGVRELYTQHASTHKTEMSSNLSYKSAPEEHFNELMSDFYPPWPTALETRQSLLNPRTSTSSWELWIATHLAFLKRTFLKIEVEGVKFCFPVERTKKSANDLPKQEYLVIEMPLIIVQPEAPNAIPFERPFFLRTKPIEIKEQVLYPLKIVLTDVHGYSLHGSSLKLMFLPNVSARLTLTLSDKLAENKYPTIFACIHCDIPPVKIVLSTLQVKLLMQIMETVMQTADVIRRISESSFFLSIDPSWENIENNEPTRRASSSEVLERTRISGRWLRGEHGSQSSVSIFESIPHSVETEESLRKSDTPSQRTDQFQKKATFWAQITLSHFQLILRNGETPLASDVTNQVVLEIEDVVSALDLQPVYVKLTLKVGNLSLRCYERNEKGTWDFGKHNGVIISSGDDITHDIEILGALETEEDSPEEQNALNLASSSGAKHGFLNLTFTRVLARNYHRKSEVRSPTAKWNALLKKYFNICCEEREDRRTLDEIDIKIRPIDFMFCPDMLLPFQAMLHSVLYTHRSEADQAELYTKTFDGDNEQKILALNNNTLPLLYLETEMIRVFIQCKKNQDNITPNRSHDIGLLQVASITLFPQTENPLTRTPVKRDLYTLAEKASILCIPGSPVEDRQYQLDIRDLSIVTCNSGNLMKNSRKEFAHRSSAFLRAMGENPAFEWNIKQEQVQAVDDVEAHILLERIEISAIFAPPVVYQASRKSIFGSTLIAGQVFEMNIPSSISISCSIEQLGCLLAISNDCSDFWNACKTSDTDETANLSSCPSASSDHVDTVQSDTTIYTLLAPQSLRAASRTELDSGIASIRKTEYFSNREAAPSDVIVTCSSIEIKLYESRRKESGKHPRHYVINPLLYLCLSQPHLIGHASNAKQNLEITTYGLSIGLGIKNSYTSESLCIPQASNYSLKVLRSIEGKKNKKTGMANAYVTLRLTDFFRSSCNASLLLFRPIHLVVTHEVLSGFQRMASTIQSLAPSHSSKADDSPHNLAASEHSLSGLSALTVISDQVVLTVKTAPSVLAAAELTFAVTDMNLTVSSKTKKAFGHFPFFANVEGSGNGIVVSSKLQEMTNIILNPWNLKFESTFQVCTWSAIPKGNVLIRAEPMSIQFGPQNLLAALQVYNEIEHFLERHEGITTPGEKFGNTVMLPTSQTFYDDLRAGIFKYVVSDSAELPGVYQIVFSHSQQTMTWRYPQARFLSKVTVLPAPIVSASSRTQEYNSAECSLLYWVEALSEFKELAVFTLSEMSGTNVQLPTIQSAHDCVSDIWRVSITTYHDEDESERDGIQPEILANCLEVNSVYNATLLQDLNVSVDLPRVTLHLMNHLALTGQVPETKLSRFSYSTPAQREQEFATIELSSSYINWNQWTDRAKFSVTSYFQCSVAEYSFLTNYSMLEPFHFQLKVGWISECVSDVDFLAKPIVLKLGGSSLHTLVSSFVIWKQHLSAYTGKGVNLSELSNETNPILSHNVMCNDTASTFNILQDGTDTYFSLLMRQCRDFHWTSAKAAPRCRIRLQNESCWSKPFELSNDGYIVRDAGNNLPVFVNIKSLSSSQKMVTISGGLIVANALNESIDVSIVFSTRNGNEMSYSIAGRSQGPSQIVDINDIHCFQFKLSSIEESNSGWSFGVTLEDMRKSVNRAVAMKLVSPESKPSSPANFNVWCALVEEKTDGFSRHLVVICPFFRVKSSLAVPTLTHVTTGKNEIENSSLLHGKGSEIQIDFVGPPDSTLHLTFQHGQMFNELTRLKNSLMIHSLCSEVTRDSRSRPTIPLNPQGPALEKKIQPLPIDEILERIILRSDCDKSWPFIREDISLTAWEQTEPQPETELQVEFSPWIQGLPSVLIDAKPWALFINLTGVTILFSENTSDSGTFKIPNAFVFTPSKIKEFFKLGIEYGESSLWSTNMEFTEQKSRTDIHYVNSDSRIPIDCYSRLEVLGKEETWYMTLETRIHKGILVLTLRPTFSIQNRTEIIMNVKCFSLLRRKEVSENELKLRQDFIVLDVDMAGARNATSEPLIMFHKVSEGPKDEARIKYLAIAHEHGPFWFVPLTNFELIFNMSASEVIPGHRMSLTLQSCQPFRTRGSFGKLARVTHPVILSWVCKYGQVWISIANDLAPPIVLLNETNGRFAVSESNGRSDLPYQDNEHFEQYLTLSPFSIGHCYLPSVNAKFPDLSKSDSDVSILLARHRDVLPGIVQLTSVYYESSQLEWSSEISLSKINGTHSFHIGDSTRTEHYQLRVERLGLSYFVYIRNISATEISAKDIRGRIAEASSSSQALNTAMVSRLDLHRKEGSTDLPHVLQADSSLTELLADADKKDIESCSSAYPFPQVRVYAPSVRLIVMDEYTYFRDRREILGVTFQDLWVDIASETDPNLLEILQNKSQENIVINIRLGDVQIDNALYEEKKFDFPVIVKRVDDYKPSPMKATMCLETIDALFQSASQEKAYVVEFTGLIGLYSPTQRNLQKVWVELQPIAVYVEDAFYYFLQPVFHDFLNIVYDRLRLIRSTPLSIESSASGLNISSEESVKELLANTPPPTQANITTASSYAFLVGPSAAAVSNVVMTSGIVEELSEAGEFGDQDSQSVAALPSLSKSLQVPSEILSIINEFGDPVRMQQILINPSTVFVTIRLSKRLYLAVDHSPLQFSMFEARSILTTNLALGHALSSHYVQGALFGSTNPMKLLGSLELLGSPGTLARSFTIGIKDFVVYPVKGLFEGPAGFVTGFTHGFSSLVTNVGSGTLTSVRNLAWSVSRNLDRMTLSENEQVQHEEDRRAPIDGVSDGIIHGLTGFGIRLLGAIGGLAQHPIESVIDNGASPMRLLAGFGRGLLGVITKPIGGAVELVAMTGQGILAGAGWTPRLQRKHSRINESVESSRNSMLKYYWLLHNETPDEEHKILRLFDASLCTTASETTPVSIVLTSENIYIVNTVLEEIESKIHISSIRVEPTSDSTKLSLRRATEKKSESISLAQERLIDFVQGCAVEAASSAGQSALPPSSHVQEPHSSAPGKPDESFSLDLYVDPNSKSEFTSLFKQVQEEKSGTIFRLL